MAMVAASVARQSLGRRISVSVVAALAVAMAVAIASIGFYNFKRNDNLVAAQSFTFEARMSAVAGGLMARGETGGLRALAASNRAERDIVSVLILNNSNTVVAQYHREGESIEKLDSVAVSARAADAKPLVAGALDFHGSYIDFLTPIMDPRDPANRLGTLAWRFDLTPWSAASLKETLVIAVIGLCFVLGLAAWLLYLLRRAMHPLAALTGTVQKLKDGQLDVEVPAVSRNDEIGALARIVAEFRDFETERRQIEAARETDAAQKRSEISRRNALVETLSRETGQSLASLDQGSEWLNSSADTLGELATHTVSRVISASQAVRRASGDIISVAQSAEELARSIAGIETQSASMKDIAGTTSQSVRATSLTMGSLAERAREIDEVVGLISAIAGQTNLLALNATIEAARAGEAGRGFAVVAQEVKSLAAQTADATSRITAQIAAVQNAAGQAVSAIGSISTRMDELDAAVTLIAAAMTEQSGTTSEIARSVSAAASAASEADREFEALESSAGETDSAAIGVRVAAEAVAAETATIRASVRHFLADVGAVRSASAERDADAA